MSKQRAYDEVFLKREIKVLKEHRFTAALCAKICRGYRKRCSGAAAIKKSKEMAS